MNFLTSFIFIVVTILPHISMANSNEKCIYITAGLFSGSTFKATYQNTCDECLEFKPIAVKGGGITTPMSNAAVRGMPITSVSLKPGESTTLFYTHPVPGTYDCKAWNVRKCK